MAQSVMFLKTWIQSPTPAKSQPGTAVHTYNPCAGNAEREEDP